MIGLKWKWTVIEANLVGTKLKLSQALFNWNRKGMGKPSVVEPRIGGTFSSRVTAEKLVECQTGSKNGAFLPESSGTIERPLPHFPDYGFVRTGLVFRFSSCRAGVVSSLRS